MNTTAMGTPKTKRTSNGVDDFVDDFIWQLILARLPVKSICRCKCVSKGWLSLLSHPYFVQKHLQSFHSNSDGEDEDDRYATTLLFVDDSAGPLAFPKSLDYPTPPFHPNGFSFYFIPDRHLLRDFEFVTVSHGWVLCRTSITSWVQNLMHHEVYYHVCNPLTQRWLDIPQPPRIKIDGQSNFPMVGFTCEEENFKPVQFKVTEFLFTSDRETPTMLHVRTFSSQTWQWGVISTIPCPHYPATYLNRSITICRDGILHYATFSEVVAVHPNFVNDVTRALAIIPLPPGSSFRNRYQRFHLGVCHGHIHFTQLENQVDGGAVLSVWKLIKNSDPTRKPYRWGLLRFMEIPNSDVVADIPGDVIPIFDSLSHGVFDVIGLSPLDSDLVYLRLKGYICLINLKNQTPKKVGEWNEDASFFKSFVPFVLPYWKLLLMKNSRDRFQF